MLQKAINLVREVNSQATKRALSARRREYCKLKDKDDKDVADEDAGPKHGGTNKVNPTQKLLSKISLVSAAKKVIRPIDGNSLVSAEWRNLGEIEVGVLEAELLQAEVVPQRLFQN